MSESPLCLHALIDIKYQEGKAKMFGQLQPGPLLSIGWFSFFFLTIVGSRKTVKAKMYSLGKQIFHLHSFLLLQVKFGPADLDECLFKIWHKRINSLK